MLGMELPGRKKRGPGSEGCRGGDYIMDIVRGDMDSEAVGVTGEDVEDRGGGVQR